ncbi:hypothetical protein RFI_09655 [Reticulomyxa filosa]|uniref:FF domain-containing protein n=1 Tax=Reticulomyxa filosa TaxID=46433 RepID=X6NNH7_RETFI|nr:hypothetical protein RFI_09655 [Reticulomyxa filosa]|eukprot:ETO27478.1 hypothetical protein RFI_09655 [Reticulomyxa filosa]
MFGPTLLPPLNPGASMLATTMHAPHGMTSSMERDSSSGIAPLSTDNPQDPSNKSHITNNSTTAINTNTNTNTNTMVTTGNNNNANSSKEEHYLGTQITKELKPVSDTVGKSSFHKKQAIQYKDWHERMKAFRQMLTDKQIHPDWNWNKVLPIIVQDPRYESIPKVNDKKKELKQWQVDERKRLEDETKRKEQLVQQQFVQMLQSKFHQLVKKSYRRTISQTKTARKVLLCSFHYTFFNLNVPRKGKRKGGGGKRKKNKK